jgi:S1-C subfamily serine protease
MRLLLAPLVIAALGGCASSGAPQEARDASLDGYPAAEQRAWHQRLGVDTALLVARIEPRDSLDTRHGTATAITSDGYWLTAAHCLGRGRISLIGEAAASWQDVAEAVVVWRGDAQEPPVDLALLYSEKLPGRGLSLSPTPAPDLALLVAGHPDGLQGLTLAAGRVLSVDPPEAGAKAIEPVLETSAPCREGDSGGPLVDPEGRLVAIAVSGRHRLFGGWTTRALRPDAGWLARTTEAHRRARAAR